MSYLPGFLACALLLSGPVSAQEDDEEGAEQQVEENEIAAPEAPAAAPVRRAGPAYRPGARRAPAPVSGSGGGGSAPARISDDGDGGQSLGGAGIGRAEPDESRAVPVRPGGVPPMRELGGGASTGGASFQEIDIGLIPTIAHLRNGRGGDRPVIHVAGGKKWAIKLQSKGSGRANYNILLGGTNGDLTGGGKYRFKAAISKSKGVVSGPGALCEGQMHNAAYTTCSTCNMSWDMRFGTPAKERRPNGGTCELDHGQVYYLNVAPEGNGCTGNPAEGFGCPLVLEPSNGAQIFLNPSGPAAACAHRGFRYEGGTCR